MVMITATAIVQLTIYLDKAKSDMDKQDKSPAMKQTRAFRAGKRMIESRQ